MSSLKHHFKTRKRTKTYELERADTKRFRLDKYGNWWGAGRSGGYEQPSVYNGLDPIDEDDRIARDHDREYFLIGDKASFGDRRFIRADRKFAKAEWKTGTLRGKVGAIAVGAQGMLRTLYGRVAGIKESTTKTETVGDLQTDNLMKYYKKPSTQRTPVFMTTRKTANGTFQNATMPWFGVYSYPRDPDDVSNPLYTVAASFVRKVMKKEFGIAFQHYMQTMDDLQPPIYDHTATQTTDTPGTTVLQETGVYSAPLPYQLVLYMRRAPNDATGQGQIRPYSVPLYQSGGVPVTFHAILTAVSTYWRSIIDSRSTYVERSEFYGYSVVRRYPIANKADTSQWLYVQTPIRVCLNMRVECYVNTKVIYQNSTLSTTSNGDSVDREPLRVREIRLKTPYVQMAPIQLKYNTTVGGADAVQGRYFLTFDQVDGLNNVTEDEDGDGYIAPSDVPFDRIPNPNIFSGVSVYADSVIKPGSIHRTGIRFKYKGYINQFLKGMCYNADPNARQQENHNRTFGTCMMIFAEEIVRTNAMNNISSHYPRLEVTCERHSGGRVIMSKPRDKFFGEYKDVVLQQGVSLDPDDDQPMATDAKEVETGILNALKNLIASNGTTNNPSGVP